MRDIQITLAQSILNKANSKEDFTTVLKQNEGRYIVAQKNLYLGSNPSICYDLLTRISNCINSNDFSSIGGWTDLDTNTYWLDANQHYNNFTLAIETAKHLGEIAIYDTIDNKVIITNDH
jgi:hypothetical protein